MKSTFRPWHLALLMITVLLLTGCGGNTALATSSWPGLAVSEGGETVYMAYGPQVYAVDTESGDDLWRFPAEQQRNVAFYARPAVSEDLLVVQSYSGMVYGLDPENGNELWSFDDPQNARLIAGSVIDDQHVYVGTVAGVMYALDRNTGEQDWSFTAERDIWSAPLLTDGMLYFTTLDRHIYALDAASGDLAWKFPSEDRVSEDSPVGPMVSTPTLHDGMLIVGTFNNDVIAVDANNPEVRWTYETENWVWGSPVFDEGSGLLIGGDVDGNVFALNPDIGEEVWTFATQGPIVSSPVLGERDGDPAVYITSGDSNIYVLDPETGEQLGTLDFKTTFTQRFLFIPTGEDELEVPIYAPPVVLEDKVIIAAHQGSEPLQAFDRDTLEPVWAFNPAAE